jgi:predicted NAD/FAD-binding protein
LHDIYARLYPADHWLVESDPILQMERIPFTIKRELMTKKNIAVIGSGISGLSAAWLLAKAHHVSLFEADSRFGGHAHTESFGPAPSKVPVDVGFIVFNAKTYPNFVQLLKALDVESYGTEMGFSVSLNHGRKEYSGGSLTQLLGSPTSALSVGHWAMLRDIARFYRSAVALSAEIDDAMSLGEFLKLHRFGKPFIEQHLMPMASAIWSSHPGHMLAYPAKAFIRFFENHQLLHFGKRDKWRSVRGGSRRYVERILASGMELYHGDAVVSIMRGPDGVCLRCASGHEAQFDDVVLATHADQALALLENPRPEEFALLSPFHYSDNSVTVHRDAKLMPRARRHWSSWNYIGAARENCSVTYWMNQLQDLGSDTDYFVSLNPARTPDPALTDLNFACRHPIFNSATLAAQKRLWHLQGQQRTWFCGAYFGAGFHEDGLQAGLAVAEQLGGVVRPWIVPNPSGRIYLGNERSITGALLQAAE